MMSVAQWLSDRLSLEAFSHLLHKKEVPVHRHSIWYYFGGMTLFLFVVQFLTGGLLMLYYRPSPETAFESVQFIMTEVSFGWLVRSIHSWSANRMIDLRMRKTDDPSDTVVTPTGGEPAATV